MSYEFCDAGLMKFSGLDIRFRIIAFIFVAANGGKCIASLIINKNQT